MRCPVVALRQLTSKFGIYCGRAGARTIRLHGRAFAERWGIAPGEHLGVAPTRSCRHHAQDPATAGDEASGWRWSHDEQVAWPQPGSNMLISPTFNPLLGIQSFLLQSLWVFSSSPHPFSNSVGATLHLSTFHIPTHLPTSHLPTHLPKIVLIPAQKFVFCKTTWKGSSLSCSSFCLNILFMWTFFFFFKISETFKLFPGYFLES